MLKINNISQEGRIDFSILQDVHNAVISVKDRMYDGRVLVFEYPFMQGGAGYYIHMHASVIPFLRNTYLELEYSGETYTQEFQFPSGNLGNFSLIGNSCLAWRTYERFNTTYNSPTIGNLILDDEEYLRFCEHIDSYLAVDMKFGESKGNINFKNCSGSARVVNEEHHVLPDYPISHHLDVEIHWIHNKARTLHFNEGTFRFADDLKNIIPPSDFKEKWNRRVQRMQGTDKIFLWSASELFNMHGAWKRKQIVDRFKSLPNRSIFLTEREEEAFEDDLHIVKFIPEWKDFNQFERDKTGGTVWNNQIANSHIIYNIIKEKFM